MGDYKEVLMEQLPFIFTTFFMLLGPIKLIPAFAGLTQGADLRFKRSVAVWGTMIATVLCVFVALAGGALLGKYRISLEALRISGGLVLLISALQVIFQKAQPTQPVTGTPKAIQLAVSPVTVPMIVPPAGVAVILVCIMLVPLYPGTMQAFAICLTIIMALNFLVMYFIDKVMKTPGLAIVLAVLGSVLVFVQVCLGIQTILNGVMGLGVVQA
jgi:multiple antibiotic resistance protein